MSSRAKAQVASLDIIISAIVLLIFIALVIALLPAFGRQREPNALYGGFVFTNIQGLRTANPSVAFVQDYRVDETKLANFADRSIVTIENELLGGNSVLHPTSSDLCIFFLNQPQATDTSTWTTIPANGTKVTIGETKGSTGLPGDCVWSNPCGEYTESFVFVKPVWRQGRIVNMFIVVCAE